jgi:hypothetical protein
LDKVAAKALKCLASHYYQLKTRHALIGAYYHRIKARDSLECKAYGGLQEIVSYILFECWERHRAWQALYKSLVEARVPLPIVAEDALEARLFSEPKATTALL